MGKEERPPHIAKLSRELLRFIPFALGGLILGAGGALVSINGSKSGIQATRPANPDAIKAAKAQYIETFRRASSTNKFAMDYLSTKSILIPPYSLNNSPNTSYLKVDFNNGCLGDSVYVIKSTNTASATATAKINPDNPNQLVIKSEDLNAVSLIFNGIKHGDVLTAADEQTRNVLMTYGCKTGLTGTSNING